MATWIECFAHIAHVKFQKACFNSNRDIKQNVARDQMAMEPKTIPPAVFQKRAGGKKGGLEQGA